MINRYITLTAAFLALSHSHLNPHGPIHENYVVSCLKEVAVKQFKHTNPKQLAHYSVDVELLTILTTRNLTSPAYEIQQSLIKALNTVSKFNIELVEDNRVDLEKELTTSYYLFVVDSLGNFEAKLEILLNLNNHNPNSLFLIYYSLRETSYSKQAKIMLEKLWGNSITNAIVLIPRTLKHLVLYTLTFNLRPAQKCVSSSGLAVLDHCVEGVFGTTREYYHSKLRGSFNNCTIDVVANAIEPFVITASRGFEIAVLEQIGESLNINFNVTLTGEDSWGVKEDGGWTNGLGMVYDDSCLGVGNFYAVPDYTQDFDFTTPHFVSDLVWVVPVAQDVPKWRVLTVIFSWHVWLLCLCVIVLSAVFLKVAAFARNECSFYRSFGNDFIAAFQIVLLSVVSKQPVSDWSRLVFASLCIFSIIITSVYTSSLINYLTRPQRERQVNSIEDVFGKAYDIGGLPVYQDIFNVTDDEKAMEIFEIFQVNDSLNTWLTSVADDKDTCTICTDFVIKHMIAEKNPILTDRQGKAKVHVIDKKIFSYSVSIVARSGFPFLDRMDRVIGMMTTFGLVQKMAKEYLHKLKSAECSEDGSYVQKLTMDHLQGAFTILILGYLLGMGAFVMEVIARCYKNLKKTVRRKQKKRRIKVSRKR